MAGQLSAHDNRFPHHSGSQSEHLEWSIRSSGFCSFLPGGNRVRGRRRPSSQEAAEVRPVSILAGLLRPFAGDDFEVLAQQLIVRFGTIQRIISASEKQIAAACHSRPDVAWKISGARALILAGMRETVERSQVNSGDPNLERYLTLKLRGRPHEELHAIFVDHSNGFIAEELVSVGDSGRVDARISSILRRAIELGARGLFLVHNHPSEKPEPSVEDVKATRSIKLVAGALDVTLFDHLIVAGREIVSMRKLGLL